MAEGRLHQLATKYGVDKLYSHSYVPVYNSLFHHRYVRRLLELGIGFYDLQKPFVPFYIHGASLLLWEEFFPQADIYACDIRDDTLVNTGRIHSMQCDLSKEEDIAKLINWLPWPIDVVIDDASHIPEQQLLVARNLLPLMNNGSLYVIEDIRSPEDGTWLVQELGPLALKRQGASIDFLKFDKRPDDSLVVVQK